MTVKNDIGVNSNLKLRTLAKKSVQYWKWQVLAESRWLKAFNDFCLLINFLVVKFPARKSQLLPDYSKSVAPYLISIATNLTLVTKVVTHQEIIGFDHFDSAAKWNFESYFGKI